MPFLQTSRVWKIILATWILKSPGTRDGITALQMDMKIKGITPEIMSQALEQARQGRLFILDKIIEIIPTPNADLKPFARRITVVRIPVDKIGAVIGPGGKMIRSIQEETGTKIDIEEDGSVYIAAARVRPPNVLARNGGSLTDVPVVGRIYTGK